MKIKRLGCLVLSALLVCSLLGVPGEAAPTVYFTSANDLLLPDLSDETMPFWSGGKLYVPYTAVSGTDLGVFYARSRDKKTSVVYRQGSALTFDFSAGTTVDQSGNYYDARAIVRGDVVFLPVELLTEFFSLDYSYTRVTYGYLVRIKSETVVLSDAKFIDAASSSMEQRYNEYMKTYRGDGDGGNDPATLPDDSIERAYLIVRVTDEETSRALLASLKSAGAKATFLFTEETLSSFGALAREIRVSGSAIALQVTSDGRTRRTLAAVERAEQALWSACSEKTRLILPLGADEDEAEALAQEGYCPIALDLDYSGDGLGALYRTANAIANMARKNGCAAYLGDDTAIAADWSDLLSRLRNLGCPIAQLSELSARRTE